MLKRIVKPKCTATATATATTTIRQIYVAKIIKMT